MIKPLNVPKHTLRDVNEVAIELTEHILKDDRYYDVQYNIEAMLKVFNSTSNELTEETIKIINKMLIKHNRPELDFKISKLGY